jgi:DNA-binding response OmpR family regulator
MTRPLALIIEDDAQLSRIYSIALQTDFETEVVRDGSTALERLKQITPVLILLDLNLPGTPGKTILAAIRSSPNLSKTYVILCTADERQADALNIDADFVLLKPVSPTQLRDLASRLSLSSTQAGIAGNIS